MFFIVLAIIAGALIVLFAAGDTTAIAGMSGDQFASLVFLGLIGTTLAASLLAGRQRAGDLIRQIAIWVAIILALVAGYEYRFELQDATSRISAGLVPGSARTATAEDGSRTVTISRNQRHFATRADVNGQPLRFIVDTGASSIVLTHDAAASAGFDTDALRYVVPVMTANGTTRAAPVTIDRIAIGGIERAGLSALVAEDGQLFKNLLGMNFLDTLSGFEVAGDRLVLRD
ncbi:TIGR02281 family clan AA aspartic protease [Oceaniradius stylonematis]|uniref:TIGR02281 family clan AA aspartic protease n=1 Tax=Oceaniradius stylonematis TaxID=2184161 RepID=UPI00273FC3F8|nr:TIGR02281 family clan AA aspartic protease [Oceaniradius stylonematis]